MKNLHLHLPLQKCFAKLIGRYENVLHLTLLSSKGEVCVSKCHFSGRNAAGRFSPFNTRQIILQAFLKTEAMLLSVACSVAANSPGSWQQVTLGNTTHWLSILNVDPKRMAMLQAQAVSLLLQESLQLVFNCIVSCKLLPSHRRDYHIRAMTGQAWALKLSQQAGSTSPTSRVRGAILMYPNEQIRYSDFTAFHSPWKAIY